MGSLPGFALPVIVLVVTLAFGLWLSRTGKPYNWLLFNIHKLTALAVVVLTVLQLIRAPGSADSLLLLIAVLALAALCVAGSFVSGAFMSMNRRGYSNLLAIHKIGSLGVTLTMALAVFLFGA
jgi:hypothetical protein